jgi:hypothetical protein
MDVRSASTIRAFRRQVTIFIICVIIKLYVYYVSSRYLCAAFGDYPHRSWVYLDRQNKGDCACADHFTGNEQTFMPTDTNTAACHSLHMAMRLSVPIAHSWNAVSLQFLNLTDSRTDSLDGGQPVARPLPTHRTTQTLNKRTQTSIPRVGFEPTIPVFWRAKIFHALDRAATVTDE